MAADYVVGAGGGQLGSLEAGAVASLTSPVISALAGGLATVAGAVAIGLALPAFTRYRRGQAGQRPGAVEQAGRKGVVLPCRRLSLSRYRGADPSGETKVPEGSGLACRWRDDADPAEFWSSGRGDSPDGAADAGVRDGAASDRQRTGP
jgi:hypothetical protein